MTDRIEHILLKDSWSSADLKALEEACTADPRLAELVRKWTTASRYIRKSFQNALPDGRLLVLYGLSTSDRASVLSPDEKEEVSQVQTQIEEALERHPSVELILERIRDDAESFEESWSEAFAPARRSVTRTPVRRIRFSSPVLRWGYSLAAVFALTIAAIVLFRQGSPAEEMMTFTAEPGQTHIINLADGSTVRLMDGSTLSYPLRVTFDRYLTLEGKAFFDVSPGDLQFQVRTENAVTSVYGTSFGISSNASLSITEVVLVSGSIALASLDEGIESVRLSPGQFSRVVGSQAPSTPQNVDLNQALRWANLFIFKDTKLSEAADRLATSFETTIVVDPVVAHKTVTGTFAREQGLREILETVASALDIQFTEDPETGEFRLSP